MRTPAFREAATAHVAVGLSLALLLAACSGGPPKTAQGLPSDPARRAALAQRLERSGFELARRAGEVPSALGPGAASTLSEADRVRSKALGAVVGEATQDAPQAALSGPVLGAPVPSASISGVLGQAGTTLVPTLAGILSMSGDAVIGHAKSSEDGKARADQPAHSFQLGGATTTVTSSTRVDGRRVVKELRMRLELPVSGQATGTLVETAEGTASVELCPDADGLTRGEVRMTTTSSFQGTAGAHAATKTGRVALSATSIGRTDDAARLASVDIDARTEVAQTLGVSEKVAGFYTDVRSGLSYSRGPSGMTDPRSGAEVVRTGGLASPEKAIELSTLAFLVLDSLYDQAEAAWRDGYCVAVDVLAPRGNDSSLEPGEQTEILAQPRHKREGTTLSAPVEASNVGGRGSVSPTGVGIPAPARFVYTAPDRPNETGEVLLRSVSRRGVGEAEISFNTYVQRTLDVEGTLTSRLEGFVLNATLTAQGIKLDSLGTSTVGLGGSGRGPIQVRGELGGPMMRASRCTATYRGTDRLFVLSRFGAGDTLTVWFETEPGKMSSRVTCPYVGGFTAVTAGTFASNWALAIGEVELPLGGDTVEATGRLSVGGTTFEARATLTLRRAEE